MPRGPVREYLRAMGLHAAYITMDGRAHSNAAPAREITDVVWTSQFGARAIALHVNNGQFATLQEAATGLRLIIVEHAEVLKLVEAGVRKVNTALAHAKADGELRHFQLAVAKYRGSTAKGMRAMTYARAHTRLRTALFVHAANGNALPPISELIDTVLGNASRPKKKIKSPKRRKHAAITLKFT